MFLLKAAGSGNAHLRKTLGEGRSYSVQQTVDERFIVAGIDDSSDRHSVSSFKTNS